MTTLWIRHPLTGGTKEVPREALAIYRQSGWDAMSEADVSDMVAAEAAQHRADEQALLSGRTGGSEQADESTDEFTDESTDESGQATSKHKRTSRKGDG